MLAIETGLSTLRNGKVSSSIVKGYRNAKTNVKCTFGMSCATTILGALGGFGAANMYVPSSKGAFIAYTSIGALLGSSMFGFLKNDIKELKAFRGEYKKIVNRAKQIYKHNLCK